MTGDGLVVLAVGYPLVGLAAGRALVQTEVVGLAPDPTAIATLGLLLLARPGWIRLTLSVIPAVWLLLTSATLLTMDEPSGWVPLGAVLVAFVATLVPRGSAKPQPCQR